MATKPKNTNKSGRRGLFGFKKTGNVSSVDPPECNAPADSTNAGDTRGVLNRKDGIHNFGVALDLLKSVGEGNELLAPLKAVCGGLKVLVDTAEASSIQQNDEDLRDLNTRLHRQLEALEQQDRTLSASELNIVHKEVEYFVKSLRTYILDLNKVQKVLDTLSKQEGGSTKKLFRKALTVYSVREEIKDCSRQLDESFQLFMNSVTSFIAHQAVLLRNDMAQMQMRADEKKANDALAQLQCSDARGNQHDSCLEGTRKDILKDITEWAANPADKPVFCLVDQAGTGKSTISIHMAQKWEKEGALAGRFFFSLPNSVTNANDLPTTLARDMANNGPSLRRLIIDAISDHPNTKGHSVKEKLEWFVFTPLKQRRDGFVKGLEEVRKKTAEKAYSQAPENVPPEISERSDIQSFEMTYRKAMEKARDETDDTPQEVLEQTYTAYAEALEKSYIDGLARSPIIVFDALDECSVVDRGILLKSVLEFLEEASLGKNQPFKVFLTSRPEGDILSYLQEPHYHQLVHHADFGMRLEGNSSNHDDIRLYANRNLGHILSAVQIDLFTTRANGLFIWASTARTFLAGALDPSTRFKDLMGSNTKSSPLDSLYDKILRSAIDQVGRDQVGLLKKVLQGLCATREPLSARVMDELLGLGNGVSLRVVKTLRSVLSDGTDDKGVRSLHPTFIEYFRAVSQPTDILFSSEDAENVLAVGCLGILTSTQLRYDICGLMEADGIAPDNDEVKDLQQRLDKNTTAGLRYAAVHGLSHVASGLGDSAVLKQLREFFEKCSLYWIEFMRFLGKTYHLMQSVHSLKLRIKDGMTGYINLLTTVDESWCDEILRLVQPFQSTIEKSALQVYFSALPFAPSTSKISHFYHQRFVDRIPKVLRGAWRMQSQCTVLSGHTRPVTCLSFSPDGRRLASGSGDHTIRLWDATTGAAVGEPLAGHTDWVRCLSFSPDSRTLASGSDDRTVQLWDTTTGAAIGEPLASHTDWVICLSFSSDGRSLASGSRDRTVRLWDATTGAAIGEPLTGHTGWVRCLSFSPDSRTLASGSDDGTVRLWDATTGAAIGEPLTGHTNVIACLSFSPGGRILASGSEDHTIRLWDATTGAAIGEPLAGHTGWVRCLSFSPDGRSLASGSRDHTIRLWDATTGAAIGEPLTGHTDEIHCLPFSPDGRILASGSDDRTLRLWDATTGAVIGELLAGHNGWVRCLSFSPDSRTLASASHDCTVRLWDATRGAAIGEPLTGHASEVRRLSFSPDGRTLASGSHDLTLRLWDATTGAAIGEPLTGHTERIECLSFSPGGGILASGSEDHTIRLWDATTGAAIGEPLAGHTNKISCLSFSPDGRILASGSYDRTLRLWDATTGAAIGKLLAGHTNFVHCLYFSPDGRTLASGSYDLTVRLWDVGICATIGQPIRHYSFIHSLSFHIHGQSLLLFIDSGVSAVWEISEDGPVKHDAEQLLPEWGVLHSKSRFDHSGTYIQWFNELRFSLPSSFHCSKYLSHEGKVAYGGMDGSVVLIDCSHLM